MAPLRIAHLSIGNTFVAKACNSLVKRGYDIHLITLTAVEERMEGVTVHSLPFGPPYGYILNAIPLRRLLRKLKPDILHVHYAGWYGMLGRLSGFHPSVMSVWGSEVLLVPKKSRIHRMLIRGNLAYYDWLCAASQMLARETRSVCPEAKPISLLPIGVDTSRFALDDSARMSGCITVGAVKRFSPVYGIDILVRAFAAARERLLAEMPELGKKLRLLIVGQGAQREEMQALANQLGIGEVTELLGWVPNNEVPKYLHRLDMFVAPSRSESFGVAIIEASACGLPVIVSNVGGLPEVCVHGVTGFHAESENVTAFTEAIVALARDRQLRETMGAAGRRFVQENFEWEHCVDMLEQVYVDVLSSSNRRSHSNYSNTAEADRS